MLQRSSSSRISMAAGTLERSKGTLRRWSCPGPLATVPPAPAVWQFGNRSRRLEGGEGRRKGRRDAEICCSMRPAASTATSRPYLTNCRTSQECQLSTRARLARRLFPPARLIRLMAPWVLGPPRPYVNRPPNAKHFPIEPDETNGEGRDNKVKTPDGPPKSYTTKCALFFRPIRSSGGFQDNTARCRHPRAAAAHQTS